MIEKFSALFRICPIPQVCIWGTVVDMQQLRGGDVQNLAARFDFRKGSGRKLMWRLATSV